MQEAVGLRRAGVWEELEQGGTGVQKETWVLCKRENSWVASGARVERPFAQRGDLGRSMGSVVIGFVGLTERRALSRMFFTIA